MARKKGKPVSFDAMVKFFMQYYSIPTKKDMDKVLDHLNRIEQMLKVISSSPGFLSGSGHIRQKKRKGQKTASDKVLDIIKKFDNGAGISEISHETGFEEKKLRNIIYRLNKTGKIRRISRGRYVV